MLTVGFVCLFSAWLLVRLSRVNPRAVQKLFSVSAWTLLFCGAPFAMLFTLSRLWCLLCLLSGCAIAIAFAFFETASGKIAVSLEEASDGDAPRTRFST